MNTNALQSRRANPTEVTPRCADPALPDADWADAFEVSDVAPGADMRSLARRTVGSMPTWARRLLRLRNALVTPLGLKPDGLKDATSAKETIDIFPILAEAEDRIVLGLDDRHLDFRIVMERWQGEAGDRVRMTTLVRRHNALGQLYLAAITPFHKAIVSAVLKGA
ncbi:MAG: DUF2867 domain-containing protein [Jannaschia sp.]